MLATEASALAFALEAGAVTITNVQAWADRYVATQAIFDEKLVAISLERDPAEALSLLHALTTDESKSTCARLVLGHLQDALAQQRIHYSRAAELLERLASLGYLPAPDTEYPMRFFAEDLALVAAGDYDHTLEDKIKEDFKDFLAKYALRYNADPAKKI